MTRSPADGAARSGCRPAGGAAAEGSPLRHRANRRRTPSTLHCTRPNLDEQRRSALMKDTGEFEASPRVILRVTNSQNFALMVAHCVRSHKTRHHLGKSGRCCGDAGSYATPEVVAGSRDDTGGRRKPLACAALRSVGGAQNGTFLVVFNKPDYYFYKERRAVSEPFRLGPTRLGNEPSSWRGFPGSS